MAHKPKTPTFAAALKRLRKAQKLSLYKLAKTAGLTLPGLIGIEAGADPKWSSVVKLADALGVSIDEFRTTTDKGG